MIETQALTLQPSLFECVDDIQAAVLSLVLNSGGSASPRGLDTTEVLGVTFGLRNPRRRCVTVPARRWSLPLAIGELCWHASASNDVRILEYYSSRWRTFADRDGRIPGSCYGHTIFGKSEAGPSQWERIVQVLSEDRSSRRAVAILARPTADAGLSAGDVACASSIQFMIRDDRLHALVAMRSNDVIWGLPYDIFLFTMLQELLSVTLNVDLGTYYHFAGSLHIYSQHVGLAQRILADKGNADFEMPTMPNTNELTPFLTRESHIRVGASKPPHSERLLHKYWEDLLDVLTWFAESKVQQSSGLTNGTILQESLYGDLARNVITPR